MGSKGPRCLVVQRDQQSALLVFADLRHHSDAGHQRCPMCVHWKLQQLVVHTLLEQVTAFGGWYGGPAPVAMKQEARSSVSSYIYCLHPIWCLYLMRVCCR